LGVLLALGLAGVAWWGVGRPTVESQEAEPGTSAVLRVLDGDTFLALHEGVGTQVRLAGIDAPEGRHDEGGRARAALAALIGGRYVELIPVDPTGRARDGYGRMVCTVVYEGRDIGAAMLASGLAVPKPSIAGPVPGSPSEGN
jgi:endonuclease YncB( thermonuclease family)